jgi:hypothetical protein
LKIGEKVLPEGLRKSCRKVLPGKSFPEVIGKVLPGGHCLGGFLPGESFPEVIGKSFPEVIVWRVLPESPSRRS